MLFLGSYNHLLYGLSVPAGAGNGALGSEFLHSTHALKLTCVAASGSLLASGSDDTNVWVFRTTTRREVGQLARHNGSITGLAFYGTKHLLSASMDGTICVWRTKVSDRDQHDGEKTRLIEEKKKKPPTGLGMSAADQGPFARRQMHGHASERTHGSDRGRCLAQGQALEFDDG